MRLLYVHPDHFPEQILAIMRDDPRFLPYFDVPFQHASPAILAAMGRRADPDANLRLVERIRAALPGAVLRSTFLLGFPGETDRDAELLARFQEEAALDWVGAFTYSREEGTRAHDLPGRVTRKVADARRAALEERQVPITLAPARPPRRRRRSTCSSRSAWRARSCRSAGPTCRPPTWTASPWYAPPRHPAAVVRVRIGRRNGFDLEGDPVSA